MSQPCGCCSGIQIITPVQELNRPGLTAISYRVGTYATFFETMVARLSSLNLDVPNADNTGTQRIYPLKGLTTRDLSDPSIALLDAWAIVADVLTFYQERIANEGYLPTSKERVSLLELARLVGYKLRPGVASTVYLAFTAATAFSGVIPAGTRAQSIPGPGQQPQYFETSDALNAREEWNAIHPRLTRSQIIAPGGVAGIDPATLHTLYFQGQTTNLKPGDGIIITTNDIPTSAATEGQMLRIVDEVNPQPDEQRTQIILRERTPAQTPTLVTVAQRYLSESSILFPGSAMAGEVAALLGDVLVHSSAAISVTSLRSLLQQLVQLESIAESRGFSRLKAWLGDLIEDLTLVARLGTFATTGGIPSGPGTAIPQLRAPASSVLTNLGNIIDTLSLPPSLQPADSLSLTRTVGQAFAPQSDLAPQLLQAFHPQAASSLYQAWANIALVPSSVKVYAARAKATLFASNFAGAATSVQIFPSTGGIQVAAENTGIQTVTSFTPPVLADAVFDLIDNNNGRLNAVPLDAAYEQIKVGSWLAIDRPNPDGTRTVTTHQVTGVQTAARETGQASPTGFAAKVTQVTLNPTWLSDLSAANFKTALQSTPLLRGTAIYGQTEALSLAEEPLDRDVSANTIELDGLYDGLQSGRWVVVTGERTDITNTTGVQASELVMIAAVEQGGSGQQSCMSFSSSILAFDSVFYVTPPNAAGERLVVGQPGNSFLTLLNQTPLPNQPGHQPICGTFQLAPGLYANAYIPTASERTGDFSDFAATLVDPFPGTSPPITNGIIPAPRITGNNAVFAWRISGITSGADTVHTTLVLANSLAYTYDSGTVSISANVTEATQGQTVGEVLGNGDGSQAFQTFALHQKPLTYVPAATPEGVQSTLDVEVNDVDWKEVDSFAALGPNDHGYTTQTDDNDQTTVIFGNGDYGARVPTGTANIKATYRYGIGSSGNVAAGQISQLATHPLGAQGVINPLPATGGADRDSILQARTNIPIAVMALDRLVSVRDYADFSRNFAGISKAVAAKLSDGRRQLVHVTVAGAGDTPIDPSDQLYQSLVASLHKFGDPLQPILVGIRKVKLLVISAGIRVQAGYHFETVGPAVRAALLDAFSFDRRSLGQSVFLSEVIGVIQSVLGVDYCNVTIFDSVAEDIDTNGLAALAANLRRRNVVRANLASVDSTQSIVGAGPMTVQQLWKRFTPAELVFLTPTIADTMILTEITAGNPGPVPALPARKLKKVNGNTSIVYVQAPQEGPK